MNIFKFKIESRNFSFIKKREVENFVSIFYSLVYTQNNVKVSYRNLRNTIFITALCNLQATARWSKSSESVQTLNNTQIEMKFNRDIFLFLQQCLSKWVSQNIIRSQQCSGCCKILKKNLNALDFQFKFQRVPQKLTKSVKVSTDQWIDVLVLERVFVARVRRLV